MNILGKDNAKMGIQFPNKAVHGGKVQEFRKIYGPDLLDVSASMNPFVPKFSYDFTCVDLKSYPDDDYSELKNVIGRVFSRNPDEICVGNGSAELIRAYCTTILDPGDAVRIDPPTFAEYELSARLAGAEIVFGDTKDSYKTRFVCNPNNPTGKLIPKEEMLGNVKSSEETGTHIFVDEAFMDVSEPDESISDTQSDNLFILRSLTKCFSVPGIRFGYGFGPIDLVERIETARTPWSVNAFAENYAIAAFEHYGKLRESAKLIAKEREWYYSRFDELGLSYHTSSVNYILLDLKRSATEFFEKMLECGVLVRDCTSFGLPESIRISVETRENNHRVLEAIEKCLR